MGNDNNKPKAFQTFYLTCHPALTPFDFQTDSSLLFTLVRMEENLLKWRKTIDPLLTKKHLFMPEKIITHEHLSDYGCCVQEDFHRMDIQYKKIYYQPFIFTLEKQILRRREKNVPFREQQIWKILGYICRAILEWTTIYPQDKMGLIWPGNVVINMEGHAKIVCRASFFDNQYLKGPENYTPPQSKQSSVIKYALNPNKDVNAIQSSHVYSLGVTLLQTMTLESSLTSSLSIEQKLLLMRSYSIYTLQLKEVISSLLQSSQMQRPRVSYLLEQSKYNRMRYQQQT